MPHSGRCGFQTGQKRRTPCLQIKERKRNGKTRSLPDKYYDKDYEHNGIHRVPLWRIACFALNNTATNLYMMMMGYATYYLMGWVGVGMMMASS